MRVAVVTVVVVALAAGAFLLKLARDGTWGPTCEGLSLFDEGGAPPGHVRPPAVLFTSSALKDGLTFLTFEVLNPNDAPVPYSGYTPGSFSGGLPEGTIAPCYRVAFRRGWRWQEHDLDFCGVGLGPVELPPKSKVTFDVVLPAGRWDSARVGLSWWDPSTGDNNRRTAWSGEVSRKEAAGR
jgi:hypothetical protein